MNWTDTLTREIEETYGATQGLLDFVDDLDWKPASGENWMTTGQLLLHCTTACGQLCRAFVTGEWPMPAGEEIPPEEMLPPADKLPAAQSVEDVRQALTEDRALALAMVGEAGEERLASEETTAPWDKQPVLLGRRLLHMVQHLSQHKGQLFYYLKLSGKPVNTWHLYGM